MINTHEEAERILMLVKQLKEGSADESMQTQIIERALIRVHREDYHNVINSVGEYHNKCGIMRVLPSEEGQIRAINEAFNHDLP